jgi:thiamine pyrophosphate-dependent acetolactate synthase large subunit-like protein
MQRIEVFRAIAPLVTADDLVTTSIGATWDDWWNLKPKADNTFFTGVLGSVTSTALGIAVSLPHRRVIAFESDGSMLMNIGILCTLGCERPANLTVVVMDNGIYENIGGPPTHTSRNTDLAKTAAGAGCLNCATEREPAAVRAQFERMLNDREMGFLVAKIAAGKHPWEWKDRKPTDGVEDKYRFLRYVEKLENVVIHPGAPQN